MKLITDESPKLSTPQLLLLADLARFTGPKSVGFFDSTMATARSLQRRGLVALADGGRRDNSSVVITSDGRKALGIFGIRQPEPHT